MNFKSLLDFKHWFGKKDAAQTADQADAGDAQPNEGGEQAKKDSNSLDDVSFYVMPKAAGAAGGTMTAAPATAASAGSPDKTKRMGMIIIAGGGVVLVGALVALIWYIFFAGPAAAPAPVANAPATASEANAPNEPVPATSTEPVDASEDDVDLSEVACGTAVWYGNATTTPLQDTAGWSCFGERLRDNCLPARLQVETAAGTAATIVLQGEQGNGCLITAEYPKISSIYDEKLEPYAGTRLQCSYAMQTSLSSDVTLAQQAYKAVSVLSLDAEHECTGTAAGVWEDLQHNEDEVVTTVTPGRDSDGDGLTDVEEQTVYVTAVDVLDTDNDGYNDGVEVENGYNPAGSGTLKDSGLIAAHANQAYGYSFWYPSAWDVQSQSGGKTVLITAPTGGFIQVIAHDNEAGDSLTQWYTNTLDVETAPAAMETANNFSYMVSEDGLTVYGMFRDDPATVLVVTYSPTNGRIEYRATFDMLVSLLAR